MSGVIHLCIASCDCMTRISIRLRDGVVCRIVMTRVRVRGSLSCVICTLLFGFTFLAQDERIETRAAEEHDQERKE